MTGVIGVIVGASAALVFVATIAALVLWRRQCDDVQRWRQWYGMR